MIIKLQNIFSNFIDYIGKYKYKDLSNRHPKNSSTFNVFHGWPIVKHFFHWAQGNFNLVISRENLDPLEHPLFFVPPVQRAPATSIGYKRAENFIF